MTLAHLLGDEDGLPSALDVDVAALGVPERRVLSAEEAQRLSAFDTADEEAESRARRRRVVGVALLAAGSAAAVAGSLALGL